MFHPSRASLTFRTLRGLQSTAFFTVYSGDGQLALRGEMPMIWDKTEIALKPREIALLNIGEIRWVKLGGGLGRATGLGDRDPNPDWEEADCAKSCSLSPEGGGGQWSPALAQRCTLELGFMSYQVDPCLRLGSQFLLGKDR